MLLLLLLVVLLAVRLTVTCPTVEEVIVVGGEVAVPVAKHLGNPGAGSGLILGQAFLYIYHTSAHGIDIWREKVKAALSFFFSAH